MTLQLYITCDRCSDKGGCDPEERVLVLEDSFTDGWAGWRECDYGHLCPKCVEDDAESERIAVEYGLERLSVVPEEIILHSSLPTAEDAR